MNLKFLLLLVIFCTNLNAELKNKHTTLIQVKPASPKAYKSGDSSKQLEKDVASCRKLIMVLGKESYIDCLDMAERKFEKENSKNH